MKVYFVTPYLTVSLESKMAESVGTQNCKYVALF